MAKMVCKSFDSPEETRTVDKGKLDVVKLGDVTAMRARFEPGWRWSECVKPVVKTEQCQLSHVGHAIQGRLTVRMQDGTEQSISAGESYTIPPGHDAWVEGDKPFVGLEVLSADQYAKR
jgi:uncharacterized cupin superfamily protein